MMKGSLGRQLDYAQEIYLADISIGCSNPPSSACNQNIGKTIKFLVITMSTLHHYMTTE